MESNLGVHFKGLQKTCVGRRQHVPGAGRDTRVTQLYTLRIAQTIFETLNKRLLLLWKKKRVTSRPPKLHHWSTSPHPLLRKDGLSKQFGRIVQAVHESKKSDFNMHPFHDEPEPCASVCTFIPVVSHSSDPDCESHFGRTVVQKFIGKNAIGFYSASALGPRDTFAVRLSFADKRYDLNIMNEQADEGQQEYGLYISSVYRRVKKSRNSVNNFKALMSQLYIQRENEVPGDIMFIRNGFEVKLDKGDTQSYVGSGKGGGSHLPTWFAQAMQHI